MNLQGCTAGSCRRALLVGAGGTHSVISVRRNRGRKRTSAAPAIRAHAGYCGDASAKASASHGSSISRYLTKMLPGWHVDGFLLDGATISARVIVSIPGSVSTSAVIFNLLVQFYNLQTTLSWQSSSNIIVFCLCHVYLYTDWGGPFIFGTDLAQIGGIRTNISCGLWWQGDGQPFLRIIVTEVTDYWQNFEEMCQVLSYYQ